MNEVLQVNGGSLARSKQNKLEQSSTNSCLLSFFKPQFAMVCDGCGPIVLSNQCQCLVAKKQKGRTLCWGDSAIIALSVMGRDGRGPSVLSKQWPSSWNRKNETMMESKSTEVVEESNAEVSGPYLSVMGRDSCGPSVVSRQCQCQVADTNRKNMMASR